MELKNYQVTVTLKNGDTFWDVVIAVSYADAQRIVYARYTDVNSILITEE